MKKIKIRAGLRLLGNALVLVLCLLIGWYFLSICFLAGVITTGVKVKNMFELPLISIASALFFVGIGIYLMWKRNRKPGSV